MRKIKYYRITYFMDKVMKFTEEVLTDMDADDFIKYMTIIPHGPRAERIEIISELQLLQHEETNPEFGRCTC